MLIKEEISDCRIKKLEFVGIRKKIWYIDFFLFQYITMLQTVASLGDYK